MGSRRAPGGALQEVIHHHRGCACPKKGVTGDGESWVHACPGKAVTEDGVAWGLCMTQEGRCRIQGIAWPMDAPGRASRGVGHHVCSGKGVVEDGVSQGPAIPPGRESCRTRHRRFLLPPGQGDPGDRMPRGPSASQECPPGVCHSWEAVAHMHAVVCPSDGCSGFAAPIGLVGPSA